MNRSILSLIILIGLIGCGDDDSTNTKNTDNLLVKSITVGPDYCEMEYNTQNQLTKFTCYSENLKDQTPNGIAQYSIYEYNGLDLSKISYYQPEFDDNGNFTNNFNLKNKTEFTQFDSSSAKAIGTYYYDFGEIEKNQLEYTFENNLIKSYKIYSEAGILSFSDEFIHNSEGNLTKLIESYYNEDGSLRRTSQKIFSDWDSGKKASEFMGVYNELIRLPGKFNSNNNYLNCIYSNGNEEKYQYEYNNLNYPTSIKFSDTYLINIEYIESN